MKKIYTTVQILVMASIMFTVAAINTNELKVHASNAYTACYHTDNVPQYDLPPDIGVPPEVDAPKNP